MRTEGLFLDMVSKAGEPHHCFAKIVRDGEKVSLEETKMSGTIVPHGFAPFYKAWGRPIPQQWDDAERAILAAAKR